jgi:cobalt-zinc-cadmium efflux system membrane fusion protein
MAIPSNSLIDLNGKNYVVVYKSKCDMKIVEVEVNKTIGNITYLKTGLTPGDKLIVQNQLLVFQQLLNQ